MSDNAANQVAIGTQTKSDGTYGFLRGGKGGQLITSDLHGKYYEQCARGNVYLGRSASGGIALLVPGTGGGHPTLWNPLGSGINVSIIRVSLSYVSGNHAPGAFEWAYTANAGAAAATGSPIATATLVASTPMLVGSGNVGAALWSPTTNTFTAAPVFFAPLGVGLHTGVAATAINPSEIIVNYDGDFVMAPGTAMSLCFQTTTTTAVFQVGVVWEEIPT